ncbi:type II toxin-antitoxin system RelE/ParE family toxin [Candidatus Gracilibacteria bacterium]|nr:type II toxin-antitoxin system RelE/ParE family toxin [Candidatus Gracilibacteria bacterium]
MKQYKIEIKDNVHIAIREIGEYIFRFSFNKTSSDTTVKNLYQEFFSLTIFPYRFPILNENYRVMTVDKKYRILYTVVEQDQTVIIAKIFSSYENYDEQINF